MPPVPTAKLVEQQRQMAKKDTSPAKPSIHHAYLNFRASLAVWIAQQTVQAISADATLKRSPERLQLRIMAAIQKAGFRAGRQLKNSGAIYTVGLQRYPANPNWIAIELELRSPCGRDTASYLFDTGKTHPFLLTKATAKLGARRERLGTWLRPGKAAGTRRFASLSRISNCKTKKSFLRAVLAERSGNNGSFVSRLENEAVLARGSMPRLWLHSDRIQIHYSGKTSGWRSHLYRRFRLNYTLAKPIVRVAPFAHSPSDFVEDWLEASTATAESMCQPGSLKKAMPWRRKLDVIRQVKREVVLRPFDVGMNRFDVGVACWGCKPAKAFFIRVRFDGRRFFVLGGREASSDDLDVIVHGPEAMKAFGHGKAKPAPKGRKPD